MIDTPSRLGTFQALQSSLDIFSGNKIVCRKYVGERTGRIDSDSVHDNSPFAAIDEHISHKLIDSMCQLSCLFLGQSRRNADGQTLVIGHLGMADR